MPRTKQVTIDFYQGNVGEDSKFSGASDVLALIAREPQRAVKIGSYLFEMAEVRSLNNGEVFSGLIRKFRKDDIPHAGEPGQPDHELDLAENEGLIEKSHFLYFSQLQLLVYQRNFHGAGITKLSKYVSRRGDETVSFDPLLQLEPLRRLLRGRQHVRSIDVRVARPTNAALIPDDNWSAHIMEILRGSGGMKLSFVIRGDGRQPAQERRCLVQRVKGSMAALFNVAEVERAKLVLEDDDRDVSTIDLVADRLYCQCSVDMVGKYPAPASMMAALNKAYDEKRELIEEILGLGAQQLA